MELSDFYWYSTLYIVGIDTLILQNCLPHDWFKIHPASFSVSTKRHHSNHYALTNKVVDWAKALNLRSLKNRWNQSADKKQTFLGHTWRLHSFACEHGQELILFKNKGACNDQWFIFLFKFKSCLCQILKYFCYDNMRHSSVETMSI